jgi:hypothetical protein
MGDTTVIGADDLAEVLWIHLVASAVEPTRSQNMTVICRRSAVDAGGAVP